MSWTQGIWPREEIPNGIVEKLEAQCAERTGGADRLEYITWHEIDRSDAIAIFESGRGFKVGKP